DHGEFAQYEGHPLSDAERTRPLSILGLNLADLSEAELARFRRDYEKLGQLNLAGTVDAREIQLLDRRLFLISERPEEIPIFDQLKKKRRDLVEVLSTTMDLVNILASLHAADLFHGSINPQSVLVHPKTGRVKL